MDLEEARALAAAAFAETRPPKPSELETWKKQRRAIADELRKFEKLWENLSPEAYSLILEAGDVLGWPDPDVGAVAGVARQLVRQAPGRPSLDRHRRAAEPLIDYFRERHGEPTGTLYKAGDAEVKRPSAAVAWLGSELEDRPYAQRGSGAYDPLYGSRAVTETERPSSFGLDLLP